MPVDNPGRRVRRALIALLADVVAVIVFCTIGRRSHAEGLTVSGIAQTAWPFLAGTAVGWLLIGGWRRPFTIIPTGLVVWVCTVVVGMLLRKATSAGVQTSFVVVASIATAVLLLGWRGAAALFRRS
jgi:peptidoglycan/LPS O-acetylase OafA/YrhL